MKCKNYASLEEYVKINTGQSVEEFLAAPEKEIENIFLGVYLIETAIDNNAPIKIIGDYDVDGILSVYNLYTTIESLGGKVSVRFPQREKEGYGLSMKIIDEILNSPERGLLITVDNGISAVKEIEIAKENGFDILIIDHHQVKKDENENPIYPKADCIINESDGMQDESVYGYTPYCGCGLATKICELLMEGKNVPEIQRNSVKVAGCIATLADAVLLKNGNRRLVIEGLKIVNSSYSGKITMNPGLESLFAFLDLGYVTEDQFYYKVAPLINAPGRLLNDGALLVFEALTCKDVSRRGELIRQINVLNEERKVLSATAFDKSIKMIEEECLKPPYVIVDESFHLGVCGIVAGRISEKFHVPSIVMSTTEEGLYKGSGRAPDDYSIFDIINKQKQYTKSFGGHPAAAGVSIEKKDLELFKTGIQEGFEIIEKEEFYDFEIQESEASSFFEKINMFAPFGQGNPKPIVLIKNMKLELLGNSFTKSMRENDFKVKTKTLDVLGFELMNKYKDEFSDIEKGVPRMIDGYGYLTKNYFNKTFTLQIQLIDFTKKDIQIQNTKLYDKLGGVAKFL